MTTRSDVIAYRRAIADLSVLAVRDVQALIRSFGDMDPVRLRNLLIETMPDVVGPYLSASGDLTATWYEDLRSAALGGSFYATSSGEVNKDQLDAMIRWGLSPKFGKSSSTVLSLMGGGVQRMVAGAGRDTIVTNVAKDPVRVGYARIPRAGCCAFCAMLASRGAVYASAATAGQETHYHDHCHCVAAPVFTGDTFHEATQAQYSALYAESVVTGGRRGAVDPKATLAAMRENGNIS